MSTRANVYRLLIIDHVELQLNSIRHWSAISLIEGFILGSISRMKNGKANERDGAILR